MARCRRCRVRSMPASWGSCSSTSTSAFATRRWPRSGPSATTSGQMDAALVRWAAASAWRSHDRRRHGDVRRPRRALHEARGRAERACGSCACTGIYSYDYLPHYFENRDVDVMADHFVADIERGIQGTDIRAAFLKCAADAAGVTEHVEKIHRAVARASVQTGAPIMAHSMPAVGTGPRQVEIFEEEGVARPRPDRPLRRHRRRRLHRGADRPGRLRGPGPLRPGDVPADRQAQRDRRRAAAARARRAADDLPGLLRVDRLVPARGRRDVRSAAERSATGR